MIGRWFLLAALLAAGVLCADTEVPAEVPPEAPAEAPVYRIQPEDRLRVALSEVGYWRAQAALVAASRELEASLAAIRRECEGSGGVFSYTGSDADITCAPPASGDEE